MESAVLCSPMGQNSSQAQFFHKDDPSLVLSPEIKEQKKPLLAFPLPVKSVLYDLICIL